MPARAQSVALAAFSMLCLLATGCHHKNHARYANAPSAYGRRSASNSSRTYSARSAPPSTRTPARPAAPTYDAEVPRELPGKPTHVETGMASWYGTQYNHRHAADGSVYDKNGFTAAHRTLPLGSLVRVTNLTTNQTVVARITDRGPFVHGRVIDLSEGAAKAIGLYRMGVAKVRVEAFPAQRASLEGQWCVQTGAFQTERDALDLKSALLSRYRTAKVTEFQGPTGFWVRIDPQGRDRTQAAAIEDWIGKPDDHAEAYLVRVD